MKVSVKNSSLVSPAQSNENGSKNRKLRLLLSGNAQSIWFVPYRTRFLFYECPENRSLSPSLQIASLKKGLEEALAEYYPLAGRLFTNEEGLLAVDCNDQGVLFIEATADISLGELQASEKDGQFDLPGELLADLEQTGGHVLKWPWPPEAPLFIIQVTTFSCGGLCISVKFSHQLLDGTGTWNFVQSWAERCRGESISVMPIIREVLTDRPAKENEEVDGESIGRSNILNSVTSDPAKFKMKCFVFKKEMLLKLKEEYPGFTTFQLISGHIWTKVTRARELNEDEETAVHFPINVRGKVSSVPVGFYGMGAMMISTTSTSVKELLSGKNHGASLVRKRIKEFTEEDAVCKAKEGMRPGNKIVKAFNKVSWCNDINLGSSFYFPVYQDFGFGKPVGMTISPVTTDGKIFYFPGLEQGNIAAYVSLEAKAMERLESDSTFLTS